MDGAENHRKWQMREVTRISPQIYDTPAIARRLAELGIPLRDALRLVRILPRMERNGMLTNFKEK